MYLHVNTGCYSKEMFELNHVALTSLLPHSLLTAPVTTTWYSATIPSLMFLSAYPVLPSPY